jgi:hypothetical protein
MKTKKKKLAMGVSLGVGAALMITSGFAVKADSNGYESYKQALKNTQAANSFTAQVGVSLADNNAELVGGTSNIKLNNKEDSQQADIKAKSGHGTVDVAMVNKDNQLVLKSSKEDVYKIIKDGAGKEDSKKEGNNHDQKEEKFNKEIENVIDVLMGNLKNQIAIDNAADGTKSVSLDLSGSQIPAAVQAVGSFGIKQALNSDHGRNKGNKKGSSDDLGLYESLAIAKELPKLTSNVVIKSISIDATITKDEILKNQKVKLIVQGQDDNGKKHEVSLSVQADFSNFNSTTVNSVDLKGKKTVVIQHKHRDHEE